MVQKWSDRAALSFWAEGSVGEGVSIMWLRMGQGERQAERLSQASGPGRVGMGTFRSCGFVIGRLAGFRYCDVVRKLKVFGFEFDRQAPGSHEIWFDARRNRYTTVPNDPGDLPEGTLRAYPEAGWYRGGRFPRGVTYGKSRS